MGAYPKQGDEREHRDHDVVQDVVRELDQLTHAIRDHTAFQQEQFQWMVRHHDGVTKGDLAMAELRIIEAIGRRSEIPADDQKLLTDSLTGLSQLAQRIERLDAAHPISAS